MLRHAGTKHGLELLLNAGNHIVQNLLNLRNKTRVLLSYYRNPRQIIQCSAYSSGFYSDSATGWATEQP